MEHVGWNERTNQTCNLEFYQKHISGIVLLFFVYLFVHNRKYNKKGYHNNAIVETLLPKNLFPEIEDIYKVAELKEDLFRLAFQRQTYPQMPGLSDFFKMLDANKIVTICVTNAPRINALAMLQGIGLTSRFSDKTLVIAEETSAPKPSPIPYLVGMERLSEILLTRGEQALKPEECVVFEGSLI